ncbi:hypothetical protein CcI6DRAFT_03795 [Frankia sp. CcI6]|nr:hypothetical protein CcI6DRAFT_03795 [Frankia sp. CcI6]KFB03336.1 hypothetical protein ALLO2DRAFT_03931 [Frankia sp. Allo2]OAA21326.1 hypothetical protein AAY23_107929 [Frankia casuarinae]
MRKMSMRVEQSTLRDRMRGSGMTHAEIAVEFTRRYRLRPRSAFRHAHGWTLQRAADHINDHAARLDIDPEGKAGMTAPRLCELEHWPFPERRRITPQILVLLATVYGTDVHNLLDVYDRERLRPADRLLIDAMECFDGTTACVCGRRRGRGDAFPSVPVPSLEVSTSTRFARSI